MPRAQRMRMVQIMRTDNPLFAPGLSAAQRLCYFNAMTHFLYALPRLIFLTAPLIYLIFGRVNLPGYWAAILAYAFPHIVLSSIANSRIQGHHRHSYWNEIYETVLAPYILIPTMLALINPKAGTFDVTAKGGVVNPAAERNPATAHMFIINPLAGGRGDSLFSTHPATANRVQALMALTGGGRQNRPIVTGRRSTAVPTTERRIGPWS